MGSQERAMTGHNHFANAYPVGGRPWSAEEDAALISARDAGQRFEDIASDLKRTINSVKCRVSHLRLSADQKRALTLQKKQAQPATVRMKIEHNSERAPSVPDEVWEARNQRLAAPRTLTGWLMGDPPAPATPTNDTVLA
jgi:hypothetical protein